MMTINIHLNGRKRSFNIESGESLADMLKRHHVTSVRKGCDTSTCGVCTVLLDDKPVLSCSLLAVKAEERHVTTVEGLPHEVEKISDAFGAEGADQCGYCNPGLALVIYALKKELSSPSDDEIKRYIIGNLCRCSGYIAQIKAIRRYLGDAQ